MKIGIVSDIHCNITALDRALELMGTVNEVICAGDAIYQYRFSNEVIGRLREIGARIILGNHEDTFLSPAGERAQRSPKNDRTLMDWLREQPLTARHRLNGAELFVVHGSPWEPVSEYVYPTSPTLRRFHEFDADIVIMGHTHQQMVTRVGRLTLINPGSTGEARDARNDWRLSFAVLDTAEGSVRMCNFPDPTRPHFAPGVRTPEPEWSITDLSGQP